MRRQCRGRAVEAAQGHHSWYIFHWQGPVQGDPFKDSTDCGVGAQLLAASASSKGWTGCNVLAGNQPQQASRAAYIRDNRQAKRSIDLKDEKSWCKTAWCTRAWWRLASSVLFPKRAWKTRGCWVLSQGRTVWACSFPSQRCAAYWGRGTLCRYHLRTTCLFSLLGRGLQPFAEVTRLHMSGWQIFQAHSKHVWRQRNSVGRGRAQTVASYHQDPVRIGRPPFVTDRLHMALVVQTAGHASCYVGCWLANVRHAACRNGRVDWIDAGFLGLENALGAFSFGSWRRDGSFFYLEGIVRCKLATTPLNMKNLVAWHFCNFLLVRGCMLQGSCRVKQFSVLLQLM